MRDSVMYEPDCHNSGDFQGTETFPFTFGNSDANHHALKYPTTPSNKLGRKKI